ncbi:DUF4276 family protein [Streptomyces sp. JJ66]|uniref:DUF4276 family protein n=1 Tax=Streptomyces sp. JJ66 TaxID=2803843 RepID=UPI001C562AC5|nr:DUF4276 family protein [Streptomyces sp. JJ66]MBW1601382.1 DUF4276 family protein [Streptomyces sp. JJ66]
MTRAKDRRAQKAGSRPTVELEVLVEEESASEALKPLLARVFQGSDVRLRVRKFQGKPDLLKKLPDRLRGYAAASRSGRDVRVVVLVDRDNDDCATLKKDLDRYARQAGLTPRADAASTGCFDVLNRIAIRELESWYFGDWDAVRKAFPKVVTEAPRAYRGNPDLPAGKASEAFEKALSSSGVRIASKPEWGRRIGPGLSVEKNRSPSFHTFLSGVRALTANNARGR